MIFADLDRRGAHGHRIDDTELAQVADVVLVGANGEAGGGLGTAPETQRDHQMRRRLMAELGVELDVQMVVFIALPSVHGSGVGRH